MDDFKTLYESIINEGDGMKLFTYDSAKEEAQKIQTGIKAPVVSATAGPLNTKEGENYIDIRVSLDAKESWRNGIFQNSRYLLFILDDNGTLDNHAIDYHLGKKMRKTKVKSIDDVVNKINSFISQFK